MASVMASPARELQSRAEEFAVEYSKIFINLASIFLGLTLTFYKDVVQPPAASWMMAAIILAWLCWIISIFCGARALSYIINASAAVRREHVNRDSTVDVRTYSIFDTELLWLLRGQQFTFLFGFVVAISGPASRMLP